MMNNPIKGVIPPMITPFKENKEVDFNKHVENMQKWNEDSLSGYLVLGSNSETPYMNEAEKIKLIELTVKNAKKDRLVLAGTGLESAKETIALTNRAADLGVDGALILTPSFYHDHMNDEAQICYFSEVADQTKIPVLIYNVTKFTNINISAKAVGILSQHENIIGMKDSNGNIPQLIAFQKVMAKGFNLMVGTASAWFPALTLGITAGICALANCAPNECAQVQQAYESQDYKKSEEIYRRVFPVNAAVTGLYGIPGLKYACDLLGYKGGEVRTPLTPLKDEQKKQLCEILKSAKLI